MPKFYRISKTQIACRFSCNYDIRRFRPNRLLSSLYNFDAIDTDFDPIKRKEMKVSSWFIIGTIKDFDCDALPYKI